MTGLATGNGRQPFLFRVAELCWLLAWLLCAVGAAHAATDAAQGYRLAGTVAVGSDYLAFLEIPGGTQVLVRNGDIVGKARVAAIRDRAIDLVLPGGRVELALAGSGKPGAAPSHDAVTRQASEGHILQREVDTDALGKSLEAAAPTRGDPGTVLARRFAPVLNLPAQGRVVSVNGDPVKSADAAVREIERMLKAGGVIYMNLDTPNGLQRVYLTPQRPEPAPNQP